MKVESKLAEGLFVVKKSRHNDSRGLFQRTYCSKSLIKEWGDLPIVQINRSQTKSVGAFRGFHFQAPPFAEKKFIQCIRGKVLDIVIDIRKDSETFLQSFATELSEKNDLCLLVPEGFAHGFQTLEPNSELLYLHSSEYNKKSEGGLNFLDPRLKIKLPLKVTDLSDRDKYFSYLEDDFEGLEL